jgi:deferrochelatase/peroxidase EfeB
LDPSLITTVIPFRQNEFVAVNDKIRSFDNDEVRGRLDEGEFVHFLSVVAVREPCPSENWKASQGDGAALAAWRKAIQGGSARPDDSTAYVIVEIAADFAVEQATAQLVRTFGKEIRAVLQTARVWPPAGDPEAEPDDEEKKKLTKFLLEHQCPIRAGWTWANWLRGPGKQSQLGQTHIGAPGMTVSRIKRERDLAQRIDEHVRSSRENDRDGKWAKASPLARLEMVRAWVWQGGAGAANAKWAFSAERAPCLPADPANPWNDSGYNARNPQALHAIGRIIHGLVWPFYGFLALVVAGLAWFFGGHKPVQLSLRLLVASALVWGAVALFLRLRRGRSWEVSGGVVTAVAVLWLGWVFYESEQVFDLIVFALPNAIAVLLVASAAFVFMLYRRLRRLEATDSVQRDVPPSNQIEALMHQENREGYVQNHMATVSRLKPGLLRKVTLRLAFLVVGTGHLVGRPGFLGKNGVIHVARWMRLPKTSLLMFWSNFDGTWESYVADFIADAPSGVTAIWSNCVGFPRTEGLFGKGAKDRDQLVNWARRQQQPTLFWYSGYRDLTTDRIRTNAAIRQGLASAASDADARDWLSLFGSSHRPAASLDADEIPTLIFGGLSTRPQACMLLFRLSDQADLSRSWLRTVEKHVTFGEARPGKPAFVLGLAASALKKLELPDAAVATFPPAFQQGMWPPWRAAALGDSHDNDPKRWNWGGTEQTSPDAVVIIYTYGDAAERPEDRLPELVKSLERDGGIDAFEKIPLDPPASQLDRNRKERSGEGWDALAEGPAESFGFTDGVSQPVIRGAPRTGGSAVTTDLVEPGELVLGYPDNTLRPPPSPSLAAKHDPLHYLPNEGTDPSRRRPEFSRYEPESGARDLGANGTFLVVRQLEEEDGAFEGWCKEVYETMRTGLGIDIDADRVDAAVHLREKATKPPTESEQKAQRNRQRLIASLLVGRWPDGSSLVRNPRSPATAKNRAARPDNAFRYGVEDPRGFACPFGAHTRRANPRDTRFHDSPAESDAEIDGVNRHRMLRVGRGYGRSVELPSKKRGLMFMCLNADIERQFEFVQKTWLLNPNIHGLQDETDPLLGRGENRHFTVPTPAGPVTFPLRNFVKVVGGAYFFLPGRATLRYLAHARSEWISAPAEAASALQSSPVRVSLREGAVADVE